MQIDGTGFIKATLNDYLEYMTSEIQADGTFGTDFTIKKEGVIDNILATTSNAFISLEDKFAFALKQINPFTAEGEYQDNLYALIGLTRQYATYTVVTRTIESAEGDEFGVNELVFKTPQGDEFYLNTPVTIGATGKATGSFTAYESGSIPCNNEDILTVISKPVTITSEVAIYYSSGNVTIIGDDYEDDSEFRARWITTRSVLPTSKTEGGLRTALLNLVSSDNDLKIRHNRTTSTVDGVPAHCMNIILKSSYSDVDIAQTILNHVTDGVGLVGVGISGVEDVSETLQDSEGTDTEVVFTRASELEIYFNVEVVLNSGYALDATAIKNSIINNFSYSMGEKVIANDFYRYINELENIDYVSVLQVKKSGGSFGSMVEPNYYEYTTVSAENITVTEA